MKIKITMSNAIFRTPNRGMKAFFNVAGPRPRTLANLAGDVNEKTAEVILAMEMSVAAVWAVAWRDAIAWSDCFGREQMSESLVPGPCSPEFSMKPLVLHDEI